MIIHIVTDAEMNTFIHGVGDIHQGRRPYVFS